MFVKHILLTALVVLSIFRITILLTYIWETLNFIFHGQSNTNDQIAHANEFGHENQLRHFRSHYRNNRHKMF